MTAPTPLACVLGGMDLVAPLGRAGIRCAVAIPADNPSRWSRHVVDRLDPLNEWTEPAAYVERLLAWAGRQDARPVLYHCTDGGLLMASRHRAELAAGFDLVLADAALVEDVTDKARFAGLAERLRLPVPAAVTLPGGDAGALRFPVVVKPVSHRGYEQLGFPGKALYVGSAAELAALCRRIEPTGLQLLAQEAVSGPESRVESYHAYVDGAGIVADFAGAKVRTSPAEYGESTELQVTDRADVRAAGRDAVARTGLRGVCKLDYKRDDAGRLHLLEINARFNLWHNLGAAAGVNLPALVYADLTGTPRPRMRPARVGATWVEPLELRRSGIGWPRWLGAVVRSDTRTTGDWSDPMPLLRGVLGPYVRRRLPRRSP